MEDLLDSEASIRQLHLIAPYEWTSESTQRDTFNLSTPREISTSVFELTLHAAYSLGVA